MRRTLLSLVTVLATLFAFAQNNARLTVATTGQYFLKIRFDGVQYSLHNSAVTFYSQSPGAHTLQIFQWSYRNNANGEWATVYNGNVNLGTNKHLEMLVHRWGKVSWDEGSQDADDWMQGTANVPAGGGTNNGNGTNGTQTNHTTADAARFAQIKNAMSAEYNQSNKLTIGRTILRDNWLTVEQIKELGSQFYNETNKLEWYKAAYDRCADRGGYFALGNTFYSSSLKTQLMEYINSK